MCGLGRGGSECIFHMITLKRINVWPGASWKSLEASVS